jgi:hypothetical protein
VPFIVRVSKLEKLLSSLPLPTRVRSSMPPPPSTVPVLEDPVPSVR